MYVNIYIPRTEEKNAGYKTFKKIKEVMGLEKGIGEFWTALSCISSLAKIYRIRTVALNYSRNWVVT